MKKKISWSLLICAGLSLIGCKNYYDVDRDPITYGDTYFKPALKTDKAVYKPGDAVSFTLENQGNERFSVLYTHLGTVIKEESLGGTSWNWTPPSEDFKGYLVYVYKTDDTQKTPLYSIAVDVSSDWKKFPRYGFLSDYGKLSTQTIEQNVETLNRFHINGIQFYDWMYDHHKPLAGTPEQPAESWLDLIGRTNYKSTVDGYIKAAHGKNMKTMFYNLLFGALADAASDGVSEKWYLFKDKAHQNKDLHELAAPFRSSIYLTNPANTEWQAYLNKRHQEVYDVYDFDGFHIDQLGDRGTVYDYDGNQVVLDKTYASFIAAAKKAFPGKYHVMNAVNQFGQENSIAPSAVDFLYTEVWDPNKSFDQLVAIIQDNDRYSGYTKNSVLAAYMNYARSNQVGFVNEPGILLTNAVIFANGGAHLELGEHYLANEYFPNANLQLRGTLKEKLVSYYDFLVGYQNLLRDGGTAKAYTVSALSDGLTVTNNQAVQGNITTYGRSYSSRDIIHFVNFKNATTMEWRDTNGTQVEPSLISNPSFKIAVTKTVKRVWVASPDIQGGVAQELAVQQQGNELTVVLPSLKYWNMVVIEY